MNVIASRRAEAYAKYLKANGIYPTVITHRWEKCDIVKDENGNVIKYSWKTWRKDEALVKEENDEYNVIRVPRYKTNLGRVQTIINKSAFFSNIFNSVLWLTGHLDSHIVDSYYNLKTFLWNHLGTNKYDLLITIFSPHYHVRLGYEIKKEFNIPFIVDYRDLWDNNLVKNTDYRPSTGKRLFNFLSKKYHSKWLKEALFYTSVSQPLVDKLAEMTRFKRGYCIMNGYESDLFSKMEKRGKKEFIILHGGTMYDGQDISYFIKGLQMFWNRVSEQDRKNVRIVFLAIRSVVKKEQFLKSLSELPIDFVPRLHRADALQLMMNASILYFPGFKTHRGIYSGKIFEYLGTKNNILVIPNDHDVVEELIHHTNAGIATDSPEEMAEYLIKNFDYWKTYGKINYIGKQEAVKEYSREFQVKKMAQLIDSNL
jgi:glycosyltransferase involved in cell wall biosynthesis